MTIALALLALALPCLILIAWTLERRERLQEIRDLRADMAVDRKAWQDERRELLNRIKPETAQYAPAVVRDPPKPVRHDSDSDYWEATLSKEDLADAVDRFDRTMAAGARVPGAAEMFAQPEADR
jgi:hypothetical protein